MLSKFVFAFALFHLIYLLFNLECKPRLSTIITQSPVTECCGAGAADFLEPSFFLELEPQKRGCRLHTTTRVAASGKDDPDPTFEKQPGSGFPNIMTRQSTGSGSELLSDSAGSWFGSGSTPMPVRLTMLTNILTLLNLSQWLTQYY